MTTDNLTALLNQEKDDEFDKLREESRQVEPPEPDPSRASSPPADAQTPPSPSEGDKPEPDLKNWVPLSAHLEEKNERKRLEKLYAEERERLARIEERHKLLEERLRPQQPAEQIPDKAQDPVGYLEYMTRQANTKAEQAFQAQQETRQRQEAMEQQQRIAAAVSSAESDFAKQTQDYYDAVEHLRSVRIKQYELAGLTQEEQQQALLADTRNWVLATLQKGKNPAEATYELARAYGYAAKSGGDLAANSGTDPVAKPRNPDGTFAPKPADPKVEKAKETLKTVERGQQASKSLGDSVGGTANTDVPSLSELATMSDEEFDQVTSGKNWKKFFV